MCEVCSAHHLKAHCIAHSGLKPYRCEVCSAKFTLADGLNKHSGIHSRLKPYKCGVCLASFTQAGSLK